MYFNFVAFGIPLFLAVETSDCPIEGGVSITNGKSSQVPFETVTVYSLNFCAISCLTNTLCQLANYKMEGNICELLKKEESSNIDDEEGWKVLQVTYDSRVSCESNNPCPANQKCYSYCNDAKKPQTICHDSPNIASSSIISYFSTSNDAPMENVIDGDLDSLGHSQYENPDFWMKLDFSATIHIQEIKIYNRKDYTEYSQRLVGFRLMSSIVDQPLEDFDLIAVLNADWIQTFSFNNEARFIAIAKFQIGIFHIHEIEVFV